MSEACTHCNGSGTHPRLPMCYHCRGWGVRLLEARTIPPGTRCRLDERVGTLESSVNEDTMVLRFEDGTAMLIAGSTTLKIG